VLRFVNNRYLRLVNYRFLDVLYSNIEKITGQTIAYPIGANLYLNITNRCTLRCQFCPKFNHSLQLNSYDLKLGHKPTETELIEAIGNPKKYTQIVFCGYGEPTLRLNTVLTVAEHIKQHGGKTRLNSDGLGNLIHKRNILADMKHLIDAISISMNASRPDVYDKHCRPQVEGAYDAMITFLTRAPYYINDVTATAIEGLNGVNIDDCRSIARWLGVKFRSRQLDKLG